LRLGGFPRAFALPEESWVRNDRKSWAESTIETGKAAVSQRHSDDSGFGYAPLRVLGNLVESEYRDAGRDLGHRDTYGSIAECGIDQAIQSFSGLHGRVE